MSGIQLNYVQITHICTYIRSKITLPMSTAFENRNPELLALDHNMAPVCNRITSCNAAILSMYMSTFKVYEI